MGGKSSEREVSLNSGKNIAEALASLGTYEVFPIDLTEENLDALPEGIDAAYIALHGGWGENGGVQAALDARRIPYTGPGVKASQIAMDKLKTKLVLEMKNVPTAKWSIVRLGDCSDCSIPFPVVVKPPKDGSSVGISKCRDNDEFRKGLELAWSVDGKSNNAPLGGRDVLHLEDHLRLHLVHRDLRREDAGTRVGNFERVERGLHTAVLAPSAVKCDVGRIDILWHRIERIVLHIHRNDIVFSKGGEGLGDVLSGHQRHLALAGGSAHQDSNTFHVPNYTIYCGIIHGE